MAKAFQFTVLFCIINFYLIKCNTVTSIPYNLFSTPEINGTPIIGILSEEMTTYLRSKYADYHSFIVASYVKFIEGGGARVVPVWIGKDRAYYEDIMSKLNGILFPGGGVSFENRNGYSDAGKYIFDIATRLNDDGDYFPLWGTCLGFELLTYLSANRTNVLVNCSSENQPLPLEFKRNFNTSRMFKKAPTKVIKILQKDPVTANFHSYCLTEKSLNDYHIDSKWRVISVNNDLNGMKFISSFEHRQYPFYGVQFHPEKNIYEWASNKNISHTARAIYASQYFAEFFVNEARKSSHHFESSRDENQYLIYNFAPEFTGAKGSGFEQCYLFPDDVKYNFR